MRNRATAWSVLLLALLGAFWSIRLAIADVRASKSDAASVLRGLRINSMNADYWQRYADLLDWEGKDSQPALLEVTRRNPLGANAWISLGLRSELDGKLDAAERYFKQAAAVDNRYDPKWSLAGFYLRRDNLPEFWRWVKSAFDISPSDPVALFQLCWRAPDADANKILALIPNRPDVLFSYVRFLGSANRLDAAEPAALRLIGFKLAAATAYLLDLCDRFLAAGRVAPAVKIWNAMCTGSMLPYQPLSPASPLTNGDFGKISSQRAFDWKITRTPGVAAHQSVNQFTATFSGDQPERCEVLSQGFPVEPNRSYTLEFDEYSTAVPADAGVSLAIWDGASRLAAVPLSSEGAWKHERISFETGKQSQWARLVLRYDRSLGSQRVEGSFMLKNISVNAAKGKYPN